MEGKPNSENSTNFDDVARAAERLERQGVRVEVKVLSSGPVGTFWDPAGNACELKNADDRFFA